MNTINRRDLISSSNKDMIRV